MTSYDDLVRQVYAGLKGLDNYQDLRAQVAALPYPTDWSLLQNTINTWAAPKRSAKGRLRPTQLDWCARHIPGFKNLLETKL